MRPEIEEVKELVIKGSAKKVAKAVQAALDAGCDASEILNQGMVEAMSEVGEQFSKRNLCIRDAGSGPRHEKGRCSSAAASCKWLHRKLGQGNYRYG